MQKLTPKRIAHLALIFLIGYLLGYGIAYAYAGLMQLFKLLTGQ